MRKFRINICLGVLLAVACAVHAQQIPGQMAGLYAQQMPPRAPVNYAMMTKTWQDAISNAAKQNGMAGSGTWTINDVVKALQGSITQVAQGDVTEPSEPAAGASPASNVSFTDFASNLFCANGVKLVNCSSSNPCKQKRCFPGSMCIVDQCGGCNAKCISLTEIGTGVNKILHTVGIMKGIPGVRDDPTAPTPNLPVVDKLVKGAQKLVNTVMPKCGPNQVLDLTAMGCRNCSEGSVAVADANACVVCGRGKYADLKSNSCKLCNPGYYSDLTTGNRFCTACPVNTYSDRSGMGTCLKCSDGYSTQGRKAQRSCIKSAFIGAAMP